MTGWNPSSSIVYGRESAGPKRFYGWCPICESYQYDERLSFVLTWGHQHRAVSHAR